MKFTLKDCQENKKFVQDRGFMMEGILQVDNPKTFLIRKTLEVSNVPTLLASKAVPQEAFLLFVGPEESLPCPSPVPRHNIIKWMYFATINNQQETLTDDAYGYSEFANWQYWRHVVLSGWVGIKNFK